VRPTKIKILGKKKFEIVKKKNLKKSIYFFVLNKTFNMA